MRGEPLLNSLTLGVVAALSSLWDLHRRRIPDQLIGAGLIVALLLSPSLGRALTGGALGFSSFLLVRLLCRGRLGLGDVKLAAYLATILGPRLWWLTVALASCAALLAMGVLACARSTDANRSLPFAPFLSVAALASLLIARLAPSFVTGVSP